jgi:hypothetical protein
MSHNRQSTAPVSRLMTSHLVLSSIRTATQSATERVPRLRYSRSTED